MQVYKGWIRYTELEEKDGSTIGSQALEKQKNTKYNTHSAQDQADEHLKTYEDEILKCIKNGKKHFDGDFYIEVLFCMDRIIPDARKTIFAARRTCPTPFFDHAVYKYTKKDDQLQYLWIVPDKDLCELYRYKIGDIPGDEKELYNNIISYYNGDLAKIEYAENNKLNDKKKIIPITRS